MKSFFRSHQRSGQRLGRVTDSGFSLVELLVVVLIIGILSGIAIPIFLSQQNQAKDAAAKSDLSNACLLYTSDAADD